MGIVFRGRERKREVTLGLFRGPSASYRQARRPSAAARQAIYLPLKAMPNCYSRERERERDSQRERELFKVHMVFLGGVNIILGKVRF